MNFAYWFCSRGCKWYLRIFHGLKTYGLNRAFPEGAVIAPNHVSFLDPPVIAGTWPSDVHFLARHTLFKPPLGWLIPHINTHPAYADAKGAATLKLIASLVRSGKKAVLFPEGTRSHDGKLGPLQQGVALIVSQTKSAAIPTYIAGAFEVWGRKRKFPKLSGKIACVYGSPIYWSDYEHLGKKEARVAFTEEIARSITNLRTWYEAGCDPKTLP